MATLKRQKADGTWEYISVVGYDVVSEISNINTELAKKLNIVDRTLGPYTEKLNTTTGVIDLSLGNVFMRNAFGESTTFTITNTKSNESHSFTLYISMGPVVRTLTFPGSIKWAGGEVPDMTKPLKMYILTFNSIDGGTTWYGSGGDY